jgi:hypothetical protein
VEKSVPLVVRRDRREELLTTDETTWKGSCVMTEEHEDSELEFDHEVDWEPVKFFGVLK